MVPILATIGENNPDAYISPAFLAPGTRLYKGVLY